jgi:hypothetical protein
METAGASLPARDDAAFGKIDVNKDGQLSRSEYMDFGKTQFEAGAGTAGMIGADKYSAAMGVQSFDPAGVDADQDKSVSSWEAASDVELDYTMRDRNADDIISKEEWQAQIGTDDDKSRWETRFSALDTDKDDRLSSDELAAWRMGDKTSSVARSTGSDTASTEESAAGSNTSTQGETTAAKPEGEDGKWSVWTFRRYSFY